MQAKKNFVFEAIGFGFRSLVENVRLFVIIMLVSTGVIAGVVGFIGFLNKGFIQSVMLLRLLQNYQQCVGSECLMAAYESGESLKELVVTNFFSLLFSAFVLALFFVGLDLGFTKVALALHDRDEVSLKTMFSCFKLAPKALASWLLYYVMIAIGLLFFLLPGFIVLLRFAFFPYFIVDKNAGVIEALKLSYEVTKEHVWDMFAFWVAIKMIIYLGFLSGVGIIITWPVSILAYGFFYRKLVSNSNLTDTLKEAVDHFKAAV